jgi:hypothetical protein
LKRAGARVRKSLPQWTGKFPARLQVKGKGKGLSMRNDAKEKLPDLAIDWQCI